MGIEMTESIYSINALFLLLISSYMTCFIVYYINFR